MPTGNLSSVASLAGLSIQSTIQRTASGQVSHEVTLPAAKAGSLTTRTDDNTGVVTLGAGHGIQQNDVVDVYWAGGLRHGMTVTGVNGNDVTVDGGAGDNLPVQGTAVTLSKQVTIDTDFDGDLMEMIAIVCSRRGHVDFRDSTPTSLMAKELLAGEMWCWVSGSGVTNPLSGNPVADVKASNGESAGEATLKIGVLYASA